MNSKLLSIQKALGDLDNELESVQQDILYNSIDENDAFSNILNNIKVVYEETKKPWEEVKNCLNIIQDLGQYIYDTRLIDLQQPENPVEDPSVDPVEDPPVDPVEDPPVDPVEDPSVDPVEEPTGEFEDDLTLKPLTIPSTEDLKNMLSDYSMESQWVDGLPWHHYDKGLSGTYSNVLKVGSTQEYKRISDAIAAAEEDALIIVDPEKYEDENHEELNFFALRIEKKLSIIGEVSQGIKPIIVGKKGQHGLSIAASDVYVRNIDFVDFDRDGCLIDGNLENIAIINCNFDNVNEGIAMQEDQATLDDLLIHSCHVAHRSIGIHVGTGKACRWILDSVTTEFVGENTSDTSCDSFATEDHSEDILVINSTFSGSPGDGIDFDVDNGHALIVDTVVKDFSRNGIKLWQGGMINRSKVLSLGAKSNINYEADAAIVGETGRFFFINSIQAGYNWAPIQESYAATFGWLGTMTEVALVNSTIGMNSGSFWVSPSAKLSVKSCKFGPTYNNRIIEHGDYTVTKENVETSTQSSFLPLEDFVAFLSKNQTPTN